jgi:hypothetical protein
MLTRDPDDEVAREGLAPTPASPVPAAPPLRAAWASAVGNQRVARMAAEYAQQAEESDAEDSAALLEELPELLAVVDEAPDGGELQAAPEGVATLRRMHVARKPKAAAAAPPLTKQDIVDLKRVGTRTINELDKLERERAITTVEAEQGKAAIQGLMERAKVGRGNRAAMGRNLNRMRAMPDALRTRAKAGRSTKDKTLISDFKVVPPVIRVAEHEATRISFVVAGTPQHIGAHILADPGAEGTSFRFFNFKPTEGFHQVIWDGTFEGRAKEPPEPGVYRIEITVTGADGKTERLFEQIRVENPDGDKVLPRVGSGLQVSTLYFDGKTLTLTDDGGNSIDVPTVSGLKANHKKNPDKIDYTDPKWEWEEGKGPIPRGTYVVNPGQFQVPDADKHGTQYASGRGTASHWGPMRVQILPNVVKNRSEFFLHMDVGNDGTAGCIGFPPSEEAKFNQIMSLIATNRKDVKLIVAY